MPAGQAGGAAARAMQLPSVLSVSAVVGTLLLGSGAAGNQHLAAVVDVKVTDAAIGGSTAEGAFLGIGWNLLPDLATWG